MRILFTTTGHSGHLLPLMPLTRTCEREGHDVLVTTQAPRAGNVERLGLPVCRRARVFDAPPDTLIGALSGAVARVPSEPGFSEIARRLGDEMAALPTADAAAAAPAA